MTPLANSQPTANEIKLLAVSGDVGGARAVLAFLKYGESRGMEFAIVEHGILNLEAPRRWNRIKLPAHDPVGIKANLETEGFNFLLFSTSVHDQLPLAIARVTRELGIPLVSIIDNRTTYTRRFVAENGEMLLPELCTVLDESSRRDAVRDGLPEEILLVAGQPAIAGLAGEYKNFTRQNRKDLLLSNRLDPDKKIILFISEPAEKDQGADESSPTFRGYTEKTILSALLHELNPYAEQLQLGLLPHPRQNRDEIARQWEEERGNLPGTVLSLPRGRDGIFLADAVCGMASILLYEAWLLGKPTLSLQPGLRDRNLNCMASCAGSHCVMKQRDVGGTTEEWIKEALAKTKSPIRKRDLRIHETSSQTIYAAMQTLSAAGGAVIKKSMKK